MRLTRIAYNYTTNYPGDITRSNHKLNNLSLGDVSQFLDEREVGCEKDNFFRQEIQNIYETVRCRVKLQQSLDINLYIRVIIVTLLWREVMTRYTTPDTMMSC